MPAKYFSINLDVTFSFRKTYNKIALMTSSNISSSSISSSSWVVAALALLVLDIFEPVVGELINQLGASKPVTGEDVQDNFLDK